MGQPLSAAHTGKILPPTVIAAMESSAIGGDLPVTLRALSQMYEQQAELRLGTIQAVLTILLVVIGVRTAWMVPRRSSACCSYVRGARVTGESPPMAEDSIAAMTVGGRFPGMCRGEGLARFEGGDQGGAWRRGAGRRSHHPPAGSPRATQARFHPERDGVTPAQIKLRRSTAPDQRHRQKQSLADRLTTAAGVWRRASV